MIAIEDCSACGYPKFGRGVCFACRGAVAMSDQTTEPTAAVTEPATEPMGSFHSGPTWS